MLSWLDERTREIRAVSYRVNFLKALTRGTINAWHFSLDTTYWHTDPLVQRGAFLTIEIKRRQTLPLRQMNPVRGHSEDRRSLGSQHVWLCSGVLASQLISLSPSYCRFHSPGLILNLIPSLQVGSSTSSAPSVDPGYLFIFAFISFQPFRFS